MTCTTSTAAYRLTRQYDCSNGMPVAIKDFNARTTVLWNLKLLDGRANAVSETYGNVTSRSDVGNYAYHATRKHAVVTAGANSYAYDANGNMSTRNGATITWTSYNLPASLSAGGYTATFNYAPDRSRWRQISTYSGGTETTIYVGGLVEKLTTSTRVHWKHRIPTPSGEVQVIRRSDGTNDVFYVTTDHLGSTDAVTNAAGAVVVRESFAAYGARRGSNWATSTAPDWTGIANTTRRAYTGHEQLDNVMLVHMNGRVYDPAIGRFLSADPYVKSMDASQGWNRYSYVSNNPLAYTDPSGYADQRPPNVQPVTPPPPPPPPDNVRTRVTWRFFFFYYDDDPLAGARAWLTAAQHLPGGMQGGEHGGGGGGGDGDGKTKKAQENPCPTVSAGQIRDALPDKGLADQAADGVKSFLQGAAWGGTALAARAGALGPTAQQQAAATNSQLGSVLSAVASNPWQTANVVGAFVSKYPVQVGMRLATGSAASFSFTPYVGFPVAALALYGSAFQGAYQQPEVVAATAIVGQVCKEP